MKPDFNKRIQKVAAQMAEDSVMILQAPASSVRNHDVYYPYRTSSDLLYLTGINQQNLVLVISNAGKVDIFAARKDKEQERWVGPSLGREEICERLGLDQAAGHDFDKYQQKLPSLLKNKETVYFPFGLDAHSDAGLLKTIQATGANSRAGNFAPTQVIHSKEILHEMRLHKDQAEIAFMKKAAQISAAAHNSLLQMCIEHSQKTVYEYEMKAHLEAEFMKRGSEFVAYPSIVAGGNNATILHYEHATAGVKKDEITLVDAGCEIEGYASDITRSFPVGGVFTSSQKDIYAIVLEAQKKALEQCQPGSNLGAIHDTTVESLVDGLWQLGLFKKVPDPKSKALVKGESKEHVIEKKLYRAFYMHQTSHYLGLDVHDAGNYFINKKHRPLEEGMVFTVEPGLYFPLEYDFVPPEFKQTGIRIEDDVLITSDGNDILSKDAIKEISDIESLAGH